MGRVGLELGQTGAEEGGEEELGALKVESEEGELEMLGFVRPAVGAHRLDHLLLLLLSQRRERERKRNENRGREKEKEEGRIETDIVVEIREKAVDGLGGPGKQDRTDALGRPGAQQAAVCCFGR